MWVAEALNRSTESGEPRSLYRKRAQDRTDGSPLGKTVRLDDYGNPIYDVYIRQVKKNKDGQYWNVPIADYPNVSQFWKYDPVAYMKQPPYSRTFQGIKPEEQGAALCSPRPLPGGGLVSEFLELEGVSVQFGALKAVDDVSIRVKRGETARDHRAERRRKTTLFQRHHRGDAFDRGQVLFDARTSTTRSGHADRRGATRMGAPPDHQSVSHLTVSEICASRSAASRSQILAVWLHALDWWRRPHGWTLRSPVAPAASPRRAGRRTAPCPRSKASPR